ncbi:MAG: 50S ribosomal protein L10 [bacterium]|nr:50S ribosomal protein L10 [bacterium]
MAQTKEQKNKILDEVKELLSQQKAVVLVGISGLKVKELSELRKKLKASGSKIKVLKKTLAKLAFAEKKIEGDEVKTSSSSSIGDEVKTSSSSSIFDREEMKTELAFVFGLEDEISPAKNAFQFSKENENLKILGGFIEGQFKEAEEMIVLAQIPSKEELFARLVGSISSPISGLVRVLQGNIKGLIYALNAIKK